MESEPIGAKSAPRNYVDLRTYERAAFEVDVTMESENNFYAGITDNISEGGVFVATLVPPLVGTLVEMALSLPGCEQPFRVKGSVCWIRDSRAAVEGAPAGCGIRWMEMSRDALAAIHRFIMHRDTILFDTEDI